MSLVERLYDVDGGAVFIDGVNIKSLNVRWWRQQIGYVGQEPKLFSGSIRENIAFGGGECCQTYVMLLYIEL